MTCASCVGRIERKLRKIDGVDPAVNLALESATVKVPQNVPDEQIVDTVHRAGYEARITGGAQQSAPASQVRGGTGGPDAAQGTTANPAPGVPRRRPGHPLVARSPSPPALPARTGTPSPTQPPTRRTHRTQRRARRRRPPPLTQLPWVPCPPMPGNAPRDSRRTSSGDRPRTSTAIRRSRPPRRSAG
ncbi:heavy-metal-associated domain-containing protein [Kocuria rhizophila]|uniref:heavy-metal-associated domain-containing protein n=1 Tax=Kocuria rhizophila TaxID=72000 RepID=UPI0035CD11E4